MSGESAGFPPLKYETVPGTGGALAVQGDKALNALVERLELYVEAAVALRDILSYVSWPEPTNHAELAHIEQIQELMRRASCILEQLGLRAKT